MVSPLAEAIPTPPATAPAAPGQLNMSSRPVTRGTLALPNRGFRGRFITRNGRVLTPSDMAGAVERLSSTGCTLEDLQKILAQYAHLPKPKTCWGKEVISTSEVRLFVWDEDAVLHLKRVQLSGRHLYRLPIRIFQIHPQSCSYLESAVAKIVVMPA